MFTIFFRRLQKYFLPVKIALLLPAVYGLYFLVMNTSPELPNIVVFAVVLSIAVATVLSFFLSVKIYFPIAISVPFLLFLKAVNLLTTLNIIIFIIFMALVEFYLFQSGSKLRTTASKDLPKFRARPLFPRGWIIGKRGKALT